MANCASLFTSLHCLLAQLQNSFYEKKYTQNIYFMQSLKSNIYWVYFFCFFILIITPRDANAQNNRMTHANTIGWYNYFGTMRLNKKWGLHTEYQFRRNHLITDWQQSLLRVGVNYQASPNLLLRVGYGWIETFPYGEFPLNGLGRDFTEHRLFQMAQLSQRAGRFDIQHRFILEQRFVGRYSSAAVKKEDEFPLMHRARYMLRIQTPFKGREIKDKTAYAAVYNEVMIGFGKNVNANIFDQNRIGLLVGYRFNKTFRIEAGYLNQTLQFGRLINGRNVFQSNSGLILNTNFNF